MDEIMIYAELEEQSTCLNCGWQGSERELGAEHDEYTCRKITEGSCPECGGVHIG